MSGPYRVSCARNVALPEPQGPSLLRTFLYYCPTTIKWYPHTFFFFFSFSLIFSRSRLTFVVHIIPIWWQHSRAQLGHDHNSLSNALPFLFQRHFHSHCRFHSHFSVSISSPKMDVTPPRRKFKPRAVYSPDPSRRGGPSYSGNLSFC